MQKIDKKSLHITSPPHQKSFSHALKTQSMFLPITLVHNPSLVRSASIVLSTINQQTMPRIVSRNTSMYKRKGSFLSRASSSTVSSSDASLSRTPVMPWYGAAGLDDLTASSSSTACSSPSMTSMRRRSVDSKRIMNSQQTMSSFGDYDVEDEIDGWGQFVDTAEAEEEVIRSSKILSKRYSIR